MDTITYDNHKISIDQSDYSESPLDWSTASERGATFVLSHNRYDLPNELDVDFDEYSNWGELAKENVPEGQPVYKFVRWYEHSGIAVSLSDSPNVGGWDSGCVGVVYGESEEVLESVFSEWKQYTEGDVWSYLITNEHDEFVDSLSGIYGYDYAVEEAKSFIDSYERPRESVYAVSAGKVHR